MESHFTTFDTFIDRSNKSIRLIIQESYITLKMTDELLSFFDWITRHMEVKYIFITSNFDYLTKGLHPKSFNSNEDLMDLAVSIYEIMQILPQIPQLLITDLRQETFNLGIDLALSSDICLARNNCKLHFNHLSLGLSPLLLDSRLKPHIYLGESIDASSLKEIITYDDLDIVLSDINSKLNQQSQCALIQTKATFLSKNPLNYLKGLIWSEDWKRIANDMQKIFPSSLKEKLL